MLNFAVGPVQMYEDTLEIAREQLPYFRTSEFSKIVLDNENLFQKLINAPVGSRTICLTASGTGAMEAAIINLFDEKDKLLIINGGSFGQRFVEITSLHKVPYIELKIKQFENITYNDLEQYSNANITALIINIHETSTGVLYDMELVKKFCQKNNCLLVVDAISSCFADEYDMDKLGIDVSIVSSQKAISLPPGLSLITLNKKVQIHIKKNPKTFYFDFNKYLEDGERGQTPFTPCVGTILQLNSRLKGINDYGIENYVKKTRSLADDFRKRVKKYPLYIPVKSLSNAVTPLIVIKKNAIQIVELLKNQYNIFILPSGGSNANYLIRVGHLGNISKDDNDKLFAALDDLLERGILI